MHKAFTEEWAEKVFKLERKKPDWEAFKSKYGQCVPKVPYTQGVINGEDMHKVVQKMSKTVPGLDGWRIHELKALGLQSWEQRARIVEVQFLVGKVPNSYKQVSTPMMPKVKGTEKIMEHRGLAIFSILWRIESGAWYRRLVQWQEEWLPEGIHGARSGHECLSSAWPAQARIEKAMLESKDRAAATLDYTKFFDRFDPHFYMCMMEEMGYPKGLAEMQRDMYADFIRHIKIAGTYGEPVQSESGMGQGCCLSLIAANATVAIEFLMLQQKVPEVEKSAFIDDRTLDTEKIHHLEAAIKEVVKMDELMGHETNVDKSKVLATTRRTRKEAKQMEIGGLKLNLVNDFKLLGHRCVAAHRFITQDAEEAAEEARIRTKRTATLPLDHANKLKVLKTSPIKVFVATTQWARAKKTSFATLTAEILRVVWGRTRQLRATEIVLGLLYEATDFHPRSAMVWNTLANARRMLTKDPNILQQAKQICRMREDRITNAIEKGKTRPTRRLNQKTSETEVKRKNGEGKGESAEKKRQEDFAKAEADRQTSKEEDHFKPQFHPDAASSDGRERVWLKVGKSEVLFIAEAKEATESATDARDTGNFLPGTARADSNRKKLEDQTEVTETDNALQEQTAQGKRLQYVPGPIGALVDQAELVGLQVKINDKDELELAREGREPIPITGWGKKAWTEEVKRHINDDLLRELHDAVKPELDEQGSPIPPRRKDMVGFPEAVDRQATLAILNNTVRKPTKKEEGAKDNVLHALDLEIKTNPKHKATLHSILAGSIRPNARMAKSHSFKPMCRCGAEKEDVQHVFNDCENHSHIREEYDTHIQKVARQDESTQESILGVLKSNTFRNCGIVPECELLQKWQDAKKDEEKDAASIRPLEELEHSKRKDEWWSDDWIRIFTDGGVADPGDHRIATGGCGIYFGQEHPLNTATTVTGRRLDSYRAELQAVRLTLSGCRNWSTKIWITLDNEAVVKDVNRCIQNKGKTCKQDNKDIWEAINLYVARRAEDFKVTWTKGHATEDDIEKGKSSEEERSRNIAADELASKGIKMNEVSNVMIKSAKQRKIVAALQQTKLVKMWLNRQELAISDQAEQKQIDEEAATIAEMEAAFEGKAKLQRKSSRSTYTAERPGNAKAETNFEATGIQEQIAREEGRRPWQYVQAKVPTYKWALEQGENKTKLKPDTMPKNLKAGQQSWWYDKPKGGSNRIRIDFPLHLWGEIGNWWQKLKWGERNPGLLKGVTWLELVTDFELSTGINCKKPQGKENWGARAELLRGIIKLILKVRGTKANELEWYYGTSKRITALAPFGAKFLSGILRRPTFVAGEATIRAVAVNAWQWAEDSKVERIQLHEVSYRNFKRGEFKMKEAEDMLNRVAKREMQKGNKQSEDETLATEEKGENKPKG